ncbi:MAG TPA: T9SS type A sorting domain-containing protein, partial [Bacteroidia bacterium]|nr:T9SS type A sorting domain-containing protein [Bacteroidia bacterium]
PNPSNGDVTLEVNGTGMHTELQVYDILGQQVKGMVINANHTTITNDELIRGVYIYRVIRDNKVIGTGKWVIQR